MTVTPQHFIESTVENMFSPRNEQHMLKAFLFRILLNWTPRKVGRRLKVSAIDVNMLVRAMDYRMTLDTYEGKRFKLDQRTCLAACIKYVQKTHVETFIAQTEVTSKRLNQHYQELYY